MLLTNSSPDSTAIQKLPYSTKRSFTSSHAYGLRLLVCSKSLISISSVNNQVSSILTCKILGIGVAAVASLMIEMKLGYLNTRQLNTHTHLLRDHPLHLCFRWRKIWYSVLFGMIQHPGRGYSQPRAILWNCVFVFSRAGLGNSSWERNSCRDVVGESTRSAAKTMINTETKMKTVTTKQRQ